MSDRTDSELLSDYVRHGRQDAFGELARRYAGLVYSSAVRQLRDPHAAEDVSQAVFIVLARKAATLRPNTPLGPWLLSVTRHAAMDYRKLQKRRQRRERDAAVQRTPDMQVGTRVTPDDEALLEANLDEALSKLSLAIRQVLVLRFFQKRSFGQIATELAISEEAARQRVSRGLVRLREILLRHGPAHFSSDGLALLLASTAVRGVPEGLIGKLAGAPGAAGSLPAALAKGVVSVMAYGKATGVAVAAAAILVVGGAIVATPHLMNHASRSPQTHATPAQAQLIGLVPGSQQFSWTDPPTAPGAGPPAKRYEGPPISGVVRVGDGTPVAGAEVVLGTQARGLPTLVVNATRVYGDTLAKTAEDGRFEFTPNSEPNSILVNCPQGFGTMRVSATQPCADVILHPWGRVEGIVRAGTKRVRDAYLSVSVPRRAEGATFGVAMQRLPMTDNQGHFVLEHVPPGPLLIYYSTKPRGNPNRVASINVQSGTTTSVTLGGTGRPVVGRINPASDPYASRQVEMRQLPPQRFRADWEKMRPSRWKQIEAQWAASAEFTVWKQLGWYTAEVEPDGTFRIEDVPPGEYSLAASAGRQDRGSGSYEKTGYAERDVIVSPMPGGRSDQPLDVGPIPIRIYKHLELGDPAPDLLGFDRSGKPVRLTDFRGRYVLFTIGPGPIMPDLGSGQYQDIRPVYDRFGDDPRVVILSFYQSDWIDDLKRAADASGIEWQQLALGDLAPDELPEQYLRGWPHMFLVDPIGRVIAKYLNAPRANYALSGPIVTADEMRYGLPTIPGGLRPLPDPLLSIRIEHLAPHGAAGDRVFREIPPVSTSNAAADATFTVVDGVPVRPVNSVDRLHDGKMQPTEDDPKHSFYFEVGTLEGRVKIDLHRTIPIAQINTYSRHKSNRSPQVYKLFASNGDGSNFNPDPKIGTDPARCGWTKIANVDTRPATDPPGEYWGVSLSRPNGKIGDYRYLLFEMYPTTSLEAFSHTFYSEVCVIAAGK